MYFHAFSGIFPTALEILANVSNLTFTYNEPFDDRESLSNAVEKEHKTEPNQIIIKCNSVNSKKYVDFLLFLVLNEI